MAQSTLSDVRNFLGASVSEMKELTPEDREELKESLDVLNLDGPR